MMRSFRPVAACLIGFVLAGSAVAAPQDATPARKKVAILIFNGAEVIDYAGPYEVFNAESDAFDVFTVAATAAPVVTGMGLEVVPKYTYATAPQADVVVIPGGMIAPVEHDPATLDWIRAETRHTRYTMSVCNGAFILANTGLLDGLTATTTRHNIERLHAEYPKVTVVRDQRYVDNGRIIATGGLSAGIDGALHVLGKMTDEGNAQMIALYLEYDAQHEGSYLPATFAVDAIPDVGAGLQKLGDWTIESTKGDARHWEISATGTSKLPAADLKKKLDALFSGAGKWTAADGGNGKDADAWTFSDADGRHWTASLSLKPLSGHTDRYAVSVAVARAQS